MTPDLATAHASPGHTTIGNHLDAPVRDIMTPGVVCLPEDASLLQAHRAMAAHRIHALLVVGDEDGRPIGWITTHGLLGWADRDLALGRAADAIDQWLRFIHPSATAREAVAAFKADGVSHLLVSRAPDRTPEGVVCETDIARLGAR